MYNLYATEIGCVAANVEKILNSKTEMVLYVIDFGHSFFRCLKEL